MFSDDSLPQRVSSDDLRLQRASSASTYKALLQQAYDLCVQDSIFPASPDAASEIHYVRHGGVEAMDLKDSPRD